MGNARVRILAMVAPLLLLPEYTGSMKPCARATPSGELDDYALVGAQRNVAVDRLVAVGKRGQDQFSAPVLRLGAHGGGLVAEIERHEQPLLRVLANEQQEIAAGDDRPVATERERRGFAPQRQQPAMEIEHGGLV